jgi:hypothetical protein
MLNPPTADFTASVTTGCSPLTVNFVNNSQNTSSYEWDFGNGTVLNVNDTLVIIVNDEPNETLIQKLIYIYEKYNIFAVVHSIKRLQFNILNHVLVPKSVILMFLPEIVVSGISN